MLIGGDKVVLEENILCVIPKETAKQSRDTRRAISKSIGTGRVQAAPGEEKCYLLCEKDGRTQVFSSPISSVRLCMRDDLEAQSKAYS